MKTLSIARISRTELVRTIVTGLGLAARRQPYVIWAVALVLAAFTGCSKDNPLGPSDYVTRPGLFSTFIYKQTESSEGNKSVITYDTLRVTGVELKIGGKRNVNEMTPSNDPQHPIYICYEDNGDLSVSLGDTGNVAAEEVAGWVTYPISSMKETETSFHSVEASGSYVPTTIRCSYIGLTTVALRGNTMAADIVSMQQRDVHSSIVSGGNLIFALDLGYFSNINEYQNSTRVLLSRELIDYQITKFRP
jgi:hypothetical protein